MKFFRCVIITVFILTVFFYGSLFVLRFAGYRPFVVLSGSMEPDIPVGSLIFIDTADAGGKEHQVGDVICYQLQDTYVTHRIYQIDSQGNYITKGDANDTVDFLPVSPEQVMGKAGFHIPVLGRMMPRII